jgi:hypothetical protein
LRKHYRWRANAQTQRHYNANGRPDLASHKTSA